MDSKSMQAGVTPALPASSSLQGAALGLSGSHYHASRRLFSTPCDTGGFSEALRHDGVGDLACQMLVLLGMAWA